MNEENQVTDPLKAWSFSTLADAFLPVTPPKYAVDGLFAHGSLNIVYGAPGTLKSMLLADAAVCVAAGLPWLRRDDQDRGFDVTQSPVMWIDFDNGPWRTRERFGALVRAYGLPADTPLTFTSVPDPYLDARNREHMVQLARIIKQKQAKLVVIDNLATVSGGVEENSSEMRLLMSNFRRLVGETEAAIVIVHHQRKEGSRSAGRLGNSLRGHSSIEAAIDLALLIARNGDSSLFTARSTKARGPDVVPFCGRFVFSHQSGTQHLETAHFEGCASEADEKELTIRARVTESLREGEATKTAFIESVAKSLSGLSAQKVRAVLETMIEEGEVCEREQKSGRSTSKLMYLCNRLSNSDDAVSMP